MSLDLNISKNKLLDFLSTVCPSTLLLKPWIFPFLPFINGLKKRVKKLKHRWSFVKKENDVWVWSVVVEYFDGRTEKYLFVGKRDLKTF
jgi:hypothetical protein